MRGVESLAEDAPPIYARGRWKRGMATRIGAVARDPQRAVDALDVANIAPVAVADVRRALQHLGETPIRPGHVRRALAGVTASLDRVEIEGETALGRARSTRTQLVAPARSLIEDELIGSPTPGVHARLADALRFDDQLDGVANSQAHDDLVASLGLDVRRRLALDLVSRPAAELTEPELRLLSRIVDTRTSGGIIEVHGDRTSGAGDIGTALRAVIDERAGDIRDVERHFAGQRIANLDLRAHAAIADRHLRAEPGSLSGHELAELEAVVANDLGARRLELVTELPGLPRFDATLRQQQFGEAREDALGRYFAANSQRRVSSFDDEDDRRIAAAVGNYSNGSRDALRLGVKVGDGDLLTRHLLALPLEQRRSIALSLLEDAGDGTTSLLPAALDVARDALVAGRVRAEFEPLRAETLRLIDVNRERLAGATAAGSTVGYGRHPEYADLGRIHTNIRTLAAFGEASHPSATGALTW